jgi:hypothetical protein
METQVAFNVTFGVLSGLAGFVLNALWTSVKDLQNSDRALIDRMSQLDVLVAGNYVRRDELDRVAAEMFRKLDNIANRLDGKVDRVNHG